MVLTAYRFFVLLTASFLGLFSSTAVKAEESSDASIAVFGRVAPTLSVKPVTVATNGGTVQVGDLVVHILFAVQANTDQVRLHVQASDLWKGGIPLGDSVSGRVAPIPLNPARQCRFEASYARPVQWGRPSVGFLQTPVYLDVFPARQSESITFASALAGRFSDEMVLTLTWTQDDPAKPMGEYSGKVKLTGMLILP